MDSMTTAESSAFAQTISQEDRARAIKQRSTKGLLLYNSGPEFAHLEGSLWAVRASEGGYWTVDLDAETCACPDFVYFGSEHDVSCKHIAACAIAHAARRGRCRELRTLSVA